MRRLLIERGHIDRLHAVDCPTMHPSTGRREGRASLDRVLAAALAHCCQPTNEERKLAALEADETTKSRMPSRARVAETAGQ